MTNKEFDLLLADIQALELDVRKAGQKEYAHDDLNIFANFDRVARDLGLDRKQVLMVYALKHLDGIKAYINGHKSQREDVRGRIKDLRMYLALLWAMVEEEEAAKEDVLEKSKDTDKVSNYYFRDSEYASRCGKVNCTGCNECEG